MKAPHARFLCVILALSTFCLPRLARAADTGPSFDCANVEPESVEAVICRSPELSKDDREMATLYITLMTLLPENENGKYRQKQRDWLAGRNYYIPNEGMFHGYYDEHIALLKSWIHEAKDPGARANKLYRNTRYGFEFRYPGDMTVIASPTNGRPWMDHTVVLIDYGLHAETHFPEVWADVRFEEGLDSESCRSSHAAVNGFFVGEQDGDGALSREWRYQDYMRYHKRACLKITFCQGHPSTWLDYRNDQKRQGDQVKIIGHYERLTEILQSFRFLDGEPASPAGRPKTNPRP